MEKARQDRIRRYGCRHVGEPIVGLTSKLDQSKGHSVYQCRARPGDLASVGSVFWCRHPIAPRTNRSSKNLSDRSIYPAVISAVITDMTARTRRGLICILATDG